ncbi:hypothetical protein RchiOBHm_Chr6g0254461 [Rosa chinensis]|uniref:KIB1-4 beta-propeller domain-containing protein n=1 Tax=Rosa chinensis TaxID=74649 RepID=A0A2P6PLN8_ROSCH|nr:putative F-box protein At5g55150 isoform X1 [Rosa chinensis]PRQ22826.1 hypothetical protein RchiOBHm_Chr6g0254461 [Rosa chinensis]
MVELKQMIDHTYSAVMRTSKSRWSELPTDIGESILKKFVPPVFDDILIFKHILSFRAVYHTWRTAAKAFCSYTGFPQTPWLLVHTRCKSSIVDPEQKKVYEIQNVYGNHHHDFSDVRCKGSSHGWMVVFHKNWDVRESLAYVVNPITRARTEIPGKATLSDSEWHSVEITKVVLSSNPSSNNFSVIVAYYTQTRFVTGALAFCKYGDTSWSKLDYPHKYIFHDILFHHDHLFALTKKQSLYVWDFTESYLKMIFNIADTTPLRSVGRSYLVESMGEVLRVVRGGENTNSAHFLVEKLNVKDKKWEKVQNLGDQSLFLFHDQSMSLPKTCFLGSEDNSIYFLQGGWLARGVINRYNLETTEVRRINSLSDLIGKELSSEELEFHFFPPVWVVPSL